MVDETLPLFDDRIRAGWGNIMTDTIPRPEVTPERYRELEMLAMQLLIQLPHQNVGECLIVLDIVRNVVRRWHEDERMARHQPQVAVTREILGPNVVRLSASERK